VATTSEIISVIKERFHLSISEPSSLAEKVAKKSPASSTQPHPKV
jgi:hypothetical protein